MADSRVSVKVLGSGCPNCQKLEAIARQAVADARVDATIEHVRDFAKIAAYGVMKTPALVINEQVKSAGRIPSKAEIAGWISTTSSGR